jgi:hypothetical protein
MAWAYGLIPASALAVALRATASIDGPLNVKASLVKLAGGAPGWKLFSACENCSPNAGPT